MGIPAAYAYAAIAIVGLVLVILVWIMLRRSQAQAVALVEQQLACEAATRRAAEHAAVADVERRDLPGGVAGPRVRDARKPIG